MGAFLLISKHSVNFNEENAVEIIKRQCKTEPVKFDLPGWNLLLFKKTLVDVENFRKSEETAIYAAGAPYIYGKSYSDSLNYIFNKLNENLTIPTILGQYFILFQKNGKLSFKTDPFGIYSVYHSSDGMIISSSFLAIAEGMEKLCLDKDTIVENLLTGSIIGSNTIFKEIKRFEPKLPFDFGDISFLPEPEREYNVVQYKNRQKSQDAQIEALDSCFSGMASIANEFGVDSGITGGFDSRLLLAMALRRFDIEKIQFHSHKRKTLDKDFIAGQEICKLKKLNFVSSAIKHVDDMDNAYIEDVFSKSMLFCDGQIRTNSFWHEEFNTAGYRINVLQDKRLGLSGIGGEQYRNMEKFLYPKWNTANWIQSELVIKNCGQKVADKKTINDTVRKISDKIKNRLKIKSKIDLTGIKQYMNYIYIPANRGLRGGYENRLSFFLYPFADPDVSDAAINAVKFLGLSMDYEAELIKRIAPDLMKVTTSYNFRFSDGEPLSRVIPHTILKNYLPDKLSNRIKEFVFSKETDLWESFNCRFESCSKYFLAVKRLGLTVNLESLIKRKELGPLVFAMGFLLDKFNKKINY